MSQVSKTKGFGDFEDAPGCASADDLYTHDARVTIARTLSEWLTHNKLTVTELLHSARALERLDSQGVTLQHALQKMAVARASGNNLPVAQMIKQLDGLCTTAIRRVYKDEKSGLFEGGAQGRFGALAEKLAGKPDRAYRLNGALAKHLATSTTWDAKLRLVLALMDELPEHEEGRRLLHTAIDSMVAEILASATVLAELLGPNPDLGSALLSLVALFLGAESSGRSQSANVLAGYFARDALPEARAAIAARILSELKSMKRLCPASWEKEFTVLRQLADALLRGHGKYLSHEDLVDVFAERSRRLVAHEPLFQLLQDARSPDQKIERLLNVEENVIGAENKRELATFILPLISAHGFEAQLGNGVLVQLKRVAELQRRVLTSGFQESQKNQLAGALDAVAKGIEERARLLASLGTRVPDPVERAQALLKLCNAGALTQGELLMKARRVMVATLAAPGFFKAYLAQQTRETGAAPESHAALNAFAIELRALGFSHEEALRAIAH